MVLRSSCLPSGWVVARNTHILSLMSLNGDEQSELRVSRHGRNHEHEMDFVFLPHLCL